MADDDVDDGSPWNGNEYLPFADLMALERVDEWNFQSTAKPFAPGAGRTAYGGHVYAQAVYAASKTIKAKEARVVCNVTGFFTQPANTTVSLKYNVRPIQDGRTFTVRTVEVTQTSPSGGSTRICFTCTATFKGAEADGPSFQEKLDLRSKYRVVLGDKQPGDWPECPAVDSPWFWEQLVENGQEANPQFPGLHCTKVDMDPYNSPLPPLQRRQLQYYAVIGAERMPDPARDPNLHACAHLYASDRNSLFAATNLLDIGNDYTQMASLAHTVIFHSSADRLGTTLPNGRQGSGDGNKWFCEEAWVTRNGAGRCVRESKMWDGDGMHIATSIQDGLVRLGQGIGSTSSADEGSAGQERMREEYAAADLARQQRRAAQGHKL